MKGVRRTATNRILGPFAIAEVAECKRCRGKGWIRYTGCGHQFIWMATKECPDCRGNGKRGKCYKR